MFLSIVHTLTPEQKRVSLVNVQLQFTHIVFSNKRWEELKDKMNPVIQDVIGDKVDEMIYIDLVATAPACQGRGYAGAILDTVGAIVRHPFPSV